MLTAACTVGVNSSNRSDPQNTENGFGISSAEICSMAAINQAAINYLWWDHSDLTAETSSINSLNEFKSYYQNNHKFEARENQILICDIQGENCSNLISLVDQNVYQPEAACSPGQANDSLNTIEDFEPDGGFNLRNASQQIAANCPLFTNAYASDADFLAIHNSWSFRVANGSDGSVNLNGTWQNISGSAADMCRIAPIMADQVSPDDINLNQISADLTRAKNKHDYIKASCESTSAYECVENEFFQLLYSEATLASHPDRGFDSIISIDEHLRCRNVSGDITNCFIGTKLTDSPITSSLIPMAELTQQIETMEFVDPEDESRSFKVEYALIDGNRYVINKCRAKPTHTVFHDSSNAGYHFEDPSDASAGANTSPNDVSYIPITCEYSNQSALQLALQVNAEQESWQVAAFQVSLDTILLIDSILLLAFAAEFVGPAAAALAGSIESASYPIIAFASWAGASEETLFTINGIAQAMISALTGTGVSAGVLAGLTAANTAYMSYSAVDSAVQLANCESDACRRKAVFNIVTDTLFAVLPPATEIYSGFGAADQAIGMGAVLQSLDILGSDASLAEKIPLTEAKILGAAMISGKVEQILQGDGSSTFKKVFLAKLASVSRDKLESEVFWAGLENADDEGVLSYLDEQIEAEGGGVCLTGGLNLTCSNGNGGNTVTNTKDQALSIHGEFTNDFDSMEQRFTQTPGTDTPAGANNVVKFGTVQGLPGEFVLRDVKNPSQLTAEQVARYENERSILLKYKYINVNEPHTDRTMIPQPLSISLNGTSSISQKLSPLTAAHMSNGQFNLSALQAQLRSMAEAIEFLHTPKESADGRYQLVAHRDIKVENMLQQSPTDYRAAITDFDLSERLSAPSEAEINVRLSLQKDGTRAVGTPKTVDPHVLKINEQINLGNRVGFTFKEMLASDVWSLGITMLEISFGKRMFYRKILGNPGSLQEFFTLYNDDGSISRAVTNYFKKSNMEILADNPSLSQEQVDGLRTFIAGDDYQMIVNEMLPVDPDIRSSIQDIVADMQQP